MKIASRTAIKHDQFASAPPRQAGEAIVTCAVLGLLGATYLLLGLYLFIGASIVALAALLDLRRARGERLSHWYDV